MSRLDDDEQYEWITRWSTKQRRMQSEILQARMAHRGRCDIVDPDAGDHREDPEEVPESGLASGHKRKTGQNERLGMEGYKYAT